jgi:hypothetical protein
MKYTYYGFESKPKIKDENVDTDSAVASARYKSDLYQFRNVKWIATNGLSGKFWSIEEVTSDYPETEQAKKSI